ncbi:unnamed protein product, partial [Didymodactylos carnosus]
MASFTCSVQMWTAVSASVAYKGHE